MFYTSLKRAFLSKLWCLGCQTLYLRFSFILAARKNVQSRMHVVRTLRKLVRNIYSGELYPSAHRQINTSSSSSCNFSSSVTHTKSCFHSNLHNYSPIDEFDALQIHFRYRPSITLLCVSALITFKEKKI